MVEIMVDIKLFIGSLLTLLSIILTLIYFLFQNYNNGIKLYVSENDSKLRSDLNDRLLKMDYEISEVKQNYMERFDEIKNLINELKVEMERRFTRLEMKINKGDVYDS